MRRIVIVVALMLMIRCALAQTSWSTLTPATNTNSGNFYLQDGNFGAQSTSNNIVYADQFAGATADVKINAALAQACPTSGYNTVPVTNGTVDARGLTGSQSLAATITMPPN
jgi:hypothetical protein